MPSLPYVVPFAVFLLFVGFGAKLPIGSVGLGALWLGVVGLLLLTIGRSALDFRTRRPWKSILVGLAVFAIWIAPDLLVTGYRDHWLFHNAVVGRATPFGPAEARTDPLSLALRAARALLVVPLVEEPFWRGWLPRWVEDPQDFRRIPVGSYTPFAFGATAVLFAAEHGSYWDVGLVAGLIYNWWMRHTKSLGDLILTHGVTNTALGAYVVLGGKWDYW